MGGAGRQEQALIRWRGEGGNSGAPVVLPDSTGIHTGADRAQTKCKRRERLGTTKTGRCQQWTLAAPRRTKTPVPQGSLFWDCSSSIHLPPKACTGAMAAHMPDSTAHQAERATQGNTAWRCQAQPWVLNTHTP